MADKGETTLRERINAGAGLAGVIAKEALGIDWYDTESQARSVAYLAAKKIVELECQREALPALPAETALEMLDNPGQPSEALQELLDIKEGMTYRNSLVGRLQAENRLLREGSNLLREANNQLHTGDLPSELFDRIDAFLLKFDEGTGSGDD